MKERIIEALAGALTSAGIQKPEVRLEFPAEMSHGDYATGVALKYAKEIGVSPKAFAEKIAAELSGIDGVADISVAGPGFINFTLAPDAVAADLEKARSQDMWGSGPAFSGKKVMVEYTDPNPFKEFHIGHLMSNAVGESVSRLFEFSGAEVHRANYQGDVGPHVAKAIWGIRNLGADPAQAAALGRAYAAGAQAYENDPAARADIDAINAKVYDRSDEQVNRLYDAGRRASLEHFEEIYATLGTKFDHYFFESETAPRGMALVKANPSVFEESDGAIVYKGEKAGLHTRVFITSKGLPTYETKDLGLAELKEETWPADLSVTVTAHEQAEYFKVVLAALNEVKPRAAEKIRHITHGMMRLPSGKMSSRTGDVITGESLLNDLIIAAKERAAESRAADEALLAKEVAVAAIKYQILKQASGKDIVFDRERALSLDGDSGPYLQYAHARTFAIVEKAKEQGVEGVVDLHIQPNSVARLARRLPETVAYAVEKMEPHILTNYLLQLAGEFNRWYANEHILDGTPAAAHKVAVTDAVRRTLKNGLWILGIPAPEKM